MTKQIEITVRARNNLLIQARLAEGMNQAQASRAIGIGIGGQALNSYECFRTSPISKRGGWTQTASRIANYYGADPGDLWPVELRKIEQPLLRFELDAHELLSEGSRRAALPVSDTYEEQELREVIERNLTTLPERSAKIVSLHLGLFGRPHTFVELGEMLGICHERVGQLFDRALARLRKLKWGEYKPIRQLRERT